MKYSPTLFLLRFRSSYWYLLFIVFFFLNTFLSIFFSVGLWGNWHIYTNISDSMKPTIEQGDLAVVAKKNMNTYQVGDIVTYYTQIDGQMEIVTHRIHSIGGNVYITKGDNNPTPDSEFLRPRLIIGQVVSTVPYLGYWVMMLKSLPGRILFIILPMFLIIWTEILQIRSYRSYR